MDFSIITPTFKQPQWLRLAAASVLDQQGVSLEYIIQDGGDGLGLDWLDGQARVQVFVENDKGMYDGLARGISKASGSIIAHLNSDEQYLPGVLRLVKDFFDAHPEVQVIFGDAILVDSVGKPLSYRRVVSPLRNHTLLCHLSTLTCSTFFRRSLVERGLSYTSEWRTVGDAALVLSWLATGIGMATIPEPLAVFAFTGANIGASLEATEEGRRLRAGWRYLGHPFLLALQHRLRKLIHGAYKTRDVTIRIFTADSPYTRKTIQSKKLGFRWPTAHNLVISQPARKPTQQPLGNFDH